MKNITSGRSHERPKNHTYRQITLIRGPEQDAQQKITTILKIIICIKVVALKNGLGYSLCRNSTKENHVETEKGGGSNIRGLKQRQAAYIIKKLHKI